MSSGQPPDGQPPDSRPSGAPQAPATDDAFSVPNSSDAAFHDLTAYTEQHDPEGHRNVAHWKHRDDHDAQDGLGCGKDFSRERLGGACTIQHLDVLTHTDQDATDERRVRGRIVGRRVTGTQRQTTPFVLDGFDSAALHLALQNWQASISGPFALHLYRWNPVMPNIRDRELALFFNTQGDLIVASRQLSLRYGEATPVVRSRRAFSPNDLEWIPYEDRPLLRELARSCHTNASPPGHPASLRVERTIGTLLGDLAARDARLGTRQQERATIVTHVQPNGRPTQDWVPGHLWESVHLSAKQRSLAQWDGPVDMMLKYQGLQDLTRSHAHHAQVNLLGRKNILIPAELALLLGPLLPAWRAGLKSSLHVDSEDRQSSRTHHVSPLTNGLGLTVGLIDEQRQERFKIHLSWQDAEELLRALHRCNRQYLNAVSDRR